METIVCSQHGLSYCDGIWWAEGKEQWMNNASDYQQGIQLLYATVISPLWLHNETPPPAVAHICHPLLRSHNIFSLRRTYGSKTMVWPVILHCCCLTELFNSPLETTGFNCELCEGFYSGVCTTAPSYCKKTSETVVGGEQTVCISPALWTVYPEDCFCLMLSNRPTELCSCGITIIQNATNIWIVIRGWKNFQLSL